MKKLLCVILAVMMLLSAAVVTSSAADTSNSTTGSGDLVYFDASGWKNVTQIYCHIWKRGGDAFLGWQLKKEKCTKVSGNKWSFDLANLNASTTMSGGLKSGEDYCIIFSAQTGKQTYDATFDKNCIGDTLKLTGETVENPVKSEKTADEAVWTNNAAKYGPHLSITSIGNVVGSKLCPNEKGTEVIGDWLPTYYKSKNFNVINALANALPKFDIKTSGDLTDVYKYIVGKNTGEDTAVIKDMLERAFVKAYPSEAVSTEAVFKLKNHKATVYVNKKYNIKFKFIKKKKSDLGFYSTKKSVATVKKGIVTPKKAGKTTIYVSYGPEEFDTIKLTVKNPRLKNKTLTIKKGKSKKIKIIGKGKYTLFYSRNKKIAKVNSNGKVTAKKKGTVKITVLTNGTSVDKTTSLETGKTQTTMKNGIKLTCKIKVV